jgi:hypothetical protein
MLYGTEIMCLSDDIVEKFEVLHRQFGKRIQGLPETTSNPASYATMGWWSIEGYIDRQKLILLRNILSLQADSIYRREAGARLTEVLHDKRVKYDGPIADMFYTSMKYSLEQPLIQILEKGSQVNKGQWKTQVVAAIKQRQYYTWKCQCLMYKKLHNYCDVVSSITMVVWWKVAQRMPSCLPACKLMMKLLSGELALCINTGRYEKEPIEVRLCELCNQEIETECHFLLVCTELTQPRELVLQAMRDLLGSNYDTFSNADSQTQVQMILGNLANQALDTLKMANVASSILHMYRMRKFKIECLSE